MLHTYQHLYNHINLQDSTLNGASAVPTLKVSTNTVLELLTSDSLKVPKCGDLRWHYVHTEFYENRSIIFIPFVESGNIHTAC